MGNNVEEVDYDELARLANSISSIAKEAGDAVKEAYNAIIQMESHWYGQSYNAVLKSLEAAQPSFNEIFVNTTVSVPSELYAKAGQYAQMNNTSLSVGKSIKDATSIAAVSIPNHGSKTRFMPDDVQNSVNSAKTKFTNAIEKINDAQQKANELESNWRSVAGTENILNYRQAMKRCGNLVKSMWESLNTQMEIMIAKINAMELAAKAGEKFDDIVDGAMDSAKNVVDSAKNIWQNMKDDYWKSSL